MTVIYGCPSTVLGPTLAIDRFFSILSELLPGPLAHSPSVNLLFSDDLETLITPSLREKKKKIGKSKIIKGKLSIAVNDETFLH